MVMALTGSAVQDSAKTENSTQAQEFLLALTWLLNLSGMCTAMNLQKKLNMKLNIITCPSAVKKVLDFPCGKGLGDWVVPNLCEFSFENSFIKKCALAHALPLPLVVARIRRLCVAQSLRVFF